MDNQLTISVEVRSVYGHDKIYPVCDRAKAFCELLGQKTLTEQDLTIIKNKIGYTVVKQITPCGMMMAVPTKHQLTSVDLTGAPLLTACL